MILGKLNIQTKYEDLDIKDFTYKEGVSTQTILEELANSEAIIWISGNPIYADDIRADYKHGVLFAPVFMQDKAETEKGIVYYNNRIECIMLHTFKAGFLCKDIVIQPSQVSNTAYRLEMQNRVIGRELHKQDLEAKELFNRYVAYSYGYHKAENDLFKFIDIRATAMKEYQRKYIKEHGLSFYGEFTEIDYRDTRDWKLIDLKENLDISTLRLDDSFGARRLSFELELYARLHDRVYWDGWTVGTMNDLLNDKREYLKYKEKGIYLIFKKGWISQV